MVLLLLLFLLPPPPPLAVLAFAPMAKLRQRRETSETGSRRDGAGGSRRHGAAEQPGRGIR